MLGTALPNQESLSIQGWHDLWHLDFCQSLWTIKHHWKGLIKLVGGLEHVLFFHILGIITPTDFHIFQTGRYTTNQMFIQPLEIYRETIAMRGGKWVMLLLHLYFANLPPKRTWGVWSNRGLWSMVKTGRIPMNSLVDGDDDPNDQHRPRGWNHQAIWCWPLVSDFFWVAPVQSAIIVPFCCFTVYSIYICIYNTFFINQTAWNHGASFIQSHMGFGWRMGTWKQRWKKRHRF